MSVEKTYQSGDLYTAETHRPAVDLEAKYKALGCAAVRAAASFKTRKVNRVLDLQMAAAIPQESD
ncbi:MAG TPA: hypothetical protein PLJ34_02235 [Hyphomicrobiales bacterium]|nr:hypothetical protein [Kaistiaceae bacterium]HQF30241.1 hypothetical protein [Hyphomicrobiales bacterium]